MTLRRVERLPCHTVAVAVVAASSGRPAGPADPVAFIPAACTSSAAEGDQVA